MRLLAVLLCATACLAQFPNEQWPRSRPEDQNVSSQRLQAALDYAFGGLGYSPSYCVTVHRNGHLIAERYASGWVGGAMTDSQRHLVWSTTKAVASTVIGMLEHRGLLRTTDFVHTYIPQLAANANSRLITIDHILRHDSGRFYDFVQDFLVSQLQPSQTNYSLTLSQTSAPGTVNQYNQMAFQLLERIVSRVTGESIATFAQRELFTPLQMQHNPQWQQTSFLIPLTNDVLAYGGLWFSCQDLARFGTLWLNRGQWRGQTLFSREFFTKATTPQQRPYGRSRTYHWGSGPVTFRAEGLGAQFTSFNAEKNLVISRIGDMLNLGFSSGQLIDRVMQALEDRDVGSWNVTEYLANNAPEPEELKFAEVLRAQRAMFNKFASPDAATDAASLFAPAQF